jgi:ADP-ribose pyrophosphatase YjhB (NUDIX family)
VLLARRNIEPQPGWWFVGGRMHPGESPEETAARHVLHDLKLQIDPNAFNFLTVASYVWARRQQLPRENGTADIAVTYYSVVNSASAARLENGNVGEYGGFAWSLLSESSARRGRQTPRFVSAVWLEPPWRRM